MKVRSIAACVLAALAVASSAFAQPPSEGQLSRDVARIVREDSQFTIFDHIDTRVEGSTVFLDGKVTSSRKKAEIERKAARLDGVTDVRTAITVLPGSPADDELRRRVARAIYSNPAFWSYAAMPNPPIHIIVERGHVTLCGAVNTQTERTMARSLATGLGEVRVTEKLIVNR
jgi:hyperosmotically inducible periplasmic protein